MTWIDVLQKTLAATLLVVCAVLLLRMVCPMRYRKQIDATLGQLRRWALYVPRRWRAHQLTRQALKSAQQKTRNQPRGQWRGNVFTPDSFSKPPDHHNAQPQDGPPSKD